MRTNVNIQMTGHNEPLLRQNRVQLRSIFLYFQQDYAAKGGEQCCYFARNLI